MYRIIDGRASGKTSRLLLLAKENNGIVVCANPSAMQSKASGYGITGLRFMSYTELFAQKDIIGSPIYIDEMEIFVKRFLSEIGHLEGYTLSNED